MLGSAVAPSLIRAALIYLTRLELKSQHAFRDNHAYFLSSPHPPTRSVSHPAGRPASSQSASHPPTPPLMLPSGECAGRRATRTRLPWVAWRRRASSRASIRATSARRSPRLWRQSSAVSGAHKTPMPPGITRMRSIRGSLPCWGHRLVAPAQPRRAAFDGFELQSLRIALQ